ncbi:MAG: hypothetical protein ABIG44_15645 [Planctomycetota bacterium]
MMGSTPVGGHLALEPGVLRVNDLLETYKPAARARVHLLLGALMWSVVGSALLAFGVYWVISGDRLLVWALLPVAIVAGWLKARFVLARTAARMIKRIRERGDGRCLGGFLSWRSWLFVAVMVTAGRLLRGGLLSRDVVGLIYTTIGAALLLAGRRIWQAWRGHELISRE